MAELDDLRRRILKQRGAKGTLPKKVRVRDKKAYPEITRTAQMRLVEDKLGDNIVSIVAESTSLRSLERKLTRKGVAVDFTTLSRWRSQFVRQLGGQQT